MDFTTPVKLGRTGLFAGRLGLGASYGAPAAAFEAAFERGCTYFYWGSLRRRGMEEALKNLIGKGKRDDLIIVIQSYARLPFILEHFVHTALRRLSIDSADLLLLGYHNGPPGRRFMDCVQSLKSKGCFKHVAISSHKRRLFGRLLDDDVYDVYHVRYNAAHRGAETDVFPCLDAKPEDSRPGIVTYTTTRWGSLLNPKKLPSGELHPQPSDCYRFVLSNPAVDVCIAGPRDMREMQDDLKALDRGPMTVEELAWMRRIGDFVYRNR